MRLKSSSVFQAFCYRHACSYRETARAAERAASLVSISPRFARIRVADDSPLPRPGSLVRLAPAFLGESGVEDIEARVTRVEGPDVQLDFTTPLPLAGSRLCQLTRR